jgi:pre-mRNA cleavage complex 2 protein Pcf11
VDLRTLTNPKAGRPPTPPPPVISGDEQSKDNCWAKLKTPSKSERESTKPLSDRNRDRLGRPRLYNKFISPDDPKERRNRVPPFSRDIDRHNERNADRNIEIIMKQAAEQLNQGTITKAQYNTLIQEVLHMSEDQKLRAAQRKEQEIGMLVWEKSVSMDGTTISQGFGVGNDENSLRKEHPSILSRPPGQTGPRWQGPWHQPWAHPPPFPTGPHGFPTGPDGFRPLGPWQNHPRLFPGPIRPDYHSPFHGTFGPRMGPPPPMGPNGPIIMANGPMKPMVTSGPINPLGTGSSMGSIPPSLLVSNGPIRPEIAVKRSPPTSGVSNIVTSNLNNMNCSAKIENLDDSVNTNKNSGQLPQADPKLIEEIAKDTMKSINIDNVPREIRYYRNTGVVFMRWDDPRDIGFQDGARRIFIDGKDSIMCNFNDDYREFTYEGEVHK